MPDTPEAGGPDISKGTAGPEVLGPEYPGFYGRLLLASQKPAAEAFNIIKRIDLPPVDKADININDPRRYNHITAGLSHAERTEAWEDVPDFDVAYPIWQAAITNEVRNTTNQQRLDVLSIVAPGVQADTFTEADARKLFEDFCNSESDIDSFISRVIHSPILRAGTHIDNLKLIELRDSLEWMLDMLVGPRVAKTATTIIQLETDINNNPGTILENIFRDPTSINNLTIPEKNMLSDLHKGFELYQRKNQSEDAEPNTQSDESPESDEETEDANRANLVVLPDQPAEPESSQNTQPAVTPTEPAGIDEEIQFLKDQIASIERGNPLPFTSMEGPDTVLRHFKKQLEKLEAKKTSTTPEPTAGEVLTTVDNPSDLIAALSPNMPVAQDEIPAGTSKATETQPPMPRIRIPMTTGGKYEIDGVVYEVTGLTSSPVGNSLTLTATNGETRKIERDQLENDVNTPGAPWKIFDLSAPTDEEQNQPETTNLVAKQSRLGSLIDRLRGKSNT